MKLNWVTATLVAGVLAASGGSGCKKDKKAEDTASSGSAATGSSMAGSSMAGSGMANPTEGSGAMAGSAMAGSAMAGSAMAGSGAAWTDADIEKMFTEVVAMFTEIGKNATGKDCAGAAAAINAGLDAHKATVDKVAKVNADDALEDRVEKMAEAKGIEKQLEEAFKPIGEVDDKCENDAAFKAAGDRLKSVIK